MMPHLRLMLLVTVASNLLGFPIAAAEKPNIVYILADDLGWTDLGCQGSKYYETPNIDRLAAHGIRFTNYHSSPNCSPSRAALMTGQYAPRTGIYTVGESERGRPEDRRLEVPRNETNLPLDRETVAGMLKKAGYATAIFGKWHLGQKDRYHPSQRGFDEAIVTMGKHFDFQTSPPIDHPKEQYLGDFLTDHAVDFIKRKKDGPFFLYLAHFEVHSPIDPKPEYAARWKKKPAAGTHSNADYAAMIQSVDESVGRVLATLDTLGLAENTIVIFSSDNGGVGSYDRTEPPGPISRPPITNNLPLRGGKGTLYEGGLRVPLIVRWPKVIKTGAQTCGVPLIHVDLLPTLAELSGAALPAHLIDGVSFASLIRDPSARLDREAIYIHVPVYLESFIHPDGWRTTPAGAMIAGDWKLIEFFETGRLELYNLAEDLGEAIDLAAKSPEKRQDLHSKLAAWREQIKAPMPTLK